MLFNYSSTEICLKFSFFTEISSFCALPDHLYSYFCCIQITLDKFSVPRIHFNTELAERRFSWQKIGIFGDIIRSPILLIFKSPSSVWHFEWVGESLDGHYISIVIVIQDEAASILLLFLTNLFHSYFCLKEEFYAFS